MMMNNPYQRSGKWTDAEQAYANALMDGFRLGHLDIDDGTSLRKLLAQKLVCNVKRISKKFEVRQVYAVYVFAVGVCLFVGNGLESFSSVLT